jgi:D-amino peptidase
LGSTFRPFCLPHGFMVMGHHAKAGTVGEFLPHTQTLEWADFRINGQSVGEMGIEICYAGHWDVPPILAQGTEIACREAEAQFPGIVTAAVKRAVNHDLCTGPEPAAARRMTAPKVVEAIGKARTGQIAPFKPALPMTVTVRFKTVEAADAAAQKTGAQRVDEHTIERRVDRHCDVVKWLAGHGLNMPPKRA